MKNGAEPFGTSSISIGEHESCSPSRRCWLTPNPQFLFGRDRMEHESNFS